MYFFARLKTDLQISIFGFAHKLLVFRIYHREYVKSARYTPLTGHNWLKSSFLQNFEMSTCINALQRVDISLIYYVSHVKL